MKISEIIKLLQNIQQEKGDVKAVMADYCKIKKVVFDEENKCVILTDSH